MIQGHEVGTEVKWNEVNTLTTGVIERVFHASTRVEIDGKQVYVEVKPNTPTYLIRHHSGTHFILPHDVVMLRQTNQHT